VVFVSGWVRWLSLAVSIALGVLWWSMRKGLRGVPANDVGH
jgi:hypothetical protein